MNNLPINNLITPEQLGVPQQYLPPVDMGGTPPLPTNSYWNTPLQERINSFSIPENYQQGMSDLDYRDGNLITNAKKDAQQIGTGLSYIYNNIWKPETWQQAGNYLLNTPNIEIAKDAANAVLHDYNVDVRNLKDRTLRDIAFGAIQGAYQHPINTLLDTISLGGFKGLGKVADAANKAVGKRILPSATGQKIENALNATGQPIRSDMYKLSEAIKDITPTNLEKLIKAAEEGTPIPKGLKADFKKLKQFSDDYDKLALKYAPNTHINPRELSIVQKIARKNNITYNEARKNAKIFVDEIEAGNIDKVKEIAKSGNPYAKQVIGANTLFDKGRIYPVTHALAEVNKKVDLMDLTDRVKNGRWSTREYGNSTYADVAKALERPDRYLEGLSEKYAQELIAKNLAEGKLGGIDVLGKEGAKDVVYVNKNSLLEGDLIKSIKNAHTQKLSPQDIPINKRVTDEIQHQLGDGNLPFAGLSKDLYTLGKNKLLAQLTYLGGNAVTGASNALLNSNIALPLDVISSALTRGKLSKELGLYRPLIHPEINKPILKQIQTINNRIGGNLARRLDVSLQNTFAEIASHAELRKMGIPFNKRIETVRDIEKQKLGQVISDARKTALINSPNTIMPKSAMSLLQTFNPFNRWLDTATQASVRLLEKSPMLTNVVLTDILANIGYNKEMQNRLNLGVSLDKPYTTYRLDDKTGQIKEINTEFVPITTSLKLIAPDPKGQMSPSIPFFTAIMNAKQGKDQYGNLIKRDPKTSTIETIGAKRFKRNADGSLEEVSGQGDEMLSTVVSELISPITLWNRTVAPLMGGITGTHYNQPYGHSLFGSFNDFADSNFFKGGNIDRQRTAEDVIKALSGRYETKYYPEDLPVGKKTLQQYYRKHNQRLQRMGGQ